MCHGFVEAGGRMLNGVFETSLCSHKRRCQFVSAPRSAFAEHSGSFQRAWSLSLRLHDALHDAVNSNAAVRIPGHCQGCALLQCPPCGIRRSRGNAGPSSLCSGQQCTHLAVAGWSSLQRECVTRYTFAWRRDRGSHGCSGCCASCRRRRCASCLQRRPSRCSQWGRATWVCRHTPRFGRQWVEFTLPQQRRDLIGTPWRWLAQGSTCQACAPAYR